MAIKIPSTRYYNREKVHKLRKDIIDKVEYSNHDLKYSVSYNTPIDGKDYQFGNNWNESPTFVEEKKVYGIDAFTTVNHKLYMEHKTYVFPISNIVIPKIQQNGLQNIIHVISGEENGIKGVQFTVRYKQIIGSVEFEDEETDSHEELPPYTKVVGTNPLVKYIDSNTKPILTSHTYAQDNPSENLPFQDKSIAIDTNFENTNSVRFELEGGNYVLYNSDNERTLYINIGASTLDAYGVYGTDGKFHWQKYGYTYEQIPLYLEVKFYGHSGKYEQIDIPLVYGDGKSVYQMTTNELFQTDTNYSISTTNPTNPLSRGVVPDDSIIDITKNVAEMKAENIVNNHRNGKEQLELLLSINEYYDENGNLAISTKNNELPMTFEQNQIVLPLKPTNRGDIPLSENRDGTPKRFIVKGVEFIFDGAVWQKIYAEEYIS